MKRSLLTMCRAIVALLVGVLLSVTSSQAQQQGYQAPNFAGMAAQAQQMPVLPASLLAGGPAAAQGNEFMDAQGRPIVLQTQANFPVQQAQYMDGGFCPPYAGGGYGDPMAVDFGGYGEDQCGPHYFDVSVDAVFLQATELFDGVGSFGAIGPAANAPRILNPSSSDNDYEPGFRIAGRYDIGALAVLEATYMGLYDIGFTDTIVSNAVSNPPNQPNQLVSVFSNFGTTPINGLDAGQIYSLDHQADLQSTEISYRRYWVGNNPRVSGTFLAGARYLRFTDDLIFGATAFIPSVGLNGFSSRTWSSENDLVGFQFGGDGWICLRQGLRLGGEAKSGIYNNRFKFTNAGTFAAGATVPPGAPALPAPANFNVTAAGNQIAFAAEGGITMVADILPSLSVRGGYQVLYLNSLATAGGNVIPNAVGLANTTAIFTQDHALFHGFHGGIEYVW